MNVVQFMTLRDLVMKVAGLDGHLDIYGTAGDGWQFDNPARLVPRSDEIDIRFGELDYFLEVEIARAVLETWREWRGSGEPSEAERIEALIHYAYHIAYIEYNWNA